LSEARSLARRVIAAVAADRFGAVLIQLRFPLGRGHFGRRRG